MDEPTRIQQIYERLMTLSPTWDPPTLSYYKGQPYKALVAAMLSAQTREVCRPTYPKCPSCPLNDVCPKAEVIPVPGAKAYRDAHLAG